MLQFIRKHQVLGGLLLFLVIASFVVFMVPDGGNPFSAMRGGVGLGKIDGKPVTETELIKAQKMTRLFRTLYPQQTRQIDENREVFSRLVLQRRIDQMNIEVPMESVAERIKLNFADPQSGKFSKEQYDQAVEYLNSRRFTERDLSEFIEQELAREQLIRMVSLADMMVTPTEAKEVTRREQRRARASMVVFNGTNYTDRIEPTVEELQQYYTNNMASYRTREKRSVTYLEFPSSQFMQEAAASITNLQDRVDATYEFRKDSMTDDEGNPLPEAEARQQIRETILERVSLSLARTAAADFSNSVAGQLSDTNLTLAAKADVLRSQALIRGIEAQTTPLFEQFGGIPNLDAGPEFASAAFRLTISEPFTPQPVESGGSLFLMALNQIQEPEVEPYEAVEARVKSSFTRDRTRELLKEDAEAYLNSLTNQIQAGSTTFEEFAASQDKQIVEVPEFSLQTTTLSNFNSVISLGTIKNTAFGLAPGEVSRFVASGQNGYILQLEEYLPADEADIESEYTNTVTQIRMQMRTGSGGYSDWIQKEIVEAGFEVAEE